MAEKTIQEMMAFNKEGKRHVPIFICEIDGKYIFAAYEGRLSEHDLLIKYRQKKKDGRWSNLRTPKHIHWAVDVLIKMHQDREKTKEFLDFLMSVWNETKPIQSQEEKKALLNVDYLLKLNAAEIKKYDSLGEKGEYSIPFLILLARLLMIQEKTNLATAYMFRNLLSALKEGEDIFKIVSTATHVGR